MTSSKRAVNEGRVDHGAVIAIGHHVPDRLEHVVLITTEMGLTGHLSNPDLQTLFKNLMPRRR
jgi:hypothetical protein